MVVKKVTKKYKSNYGKGLVCVTPGNIRYFKSAREAARIMGMKIPDIFHEMKTKGKNSSKRKWYTKDVYDKMNKKKKKR